ncbi:nuclear cap-binding protein subunit 1 [Drosophila elegans]|uniref:nuclear cap-binding protein subunit 1 n=1 Tax=Drosophila elegans TaxID=30023 RepID=UPI0007E7B7BF|nr:nuclear cap-binding protein subunit 1 [Drosophila elegans]XP_017112247.1 nuclear cap-binding protein subunit 1 [Drosophila elegans]XP_017112248.1 nuclear cap-binding protein subunit 1 [Drosophila elegans]
MDYGRRKRGHSTDEDVEDFHRKRIAEVKLATVEKLMRGLSFQGSSSIELKLENLSYLLRDVRANLKEEILCLLVSCVGEHPGHTSAYATFVGLLNVGCSEFGAECMVFMVQKLYEFLCSREWSKCQAIVHFLVNLYNCKVVSSSSLLNFLAGFVSECENQSDPDDEADSGPQTRRDWLAFCVLSALPFVGKDLQLKAGFERLMITLQIYIKKRCALHATMLSVWPNSEQEDKLELLWQQVDTMQQQQWAEPEHQLIPRPYLAFDRTLSESLPHCLPNFEVPPHEQGCSYPPTRVSFRIFSYERDDLQLPSPLRIERHLLEVQILDMLHCHHLERRVCADSLLSYAASKPQLSVHHSIVEVILGEMLQLPSSQWITLNYGSILVELCKRQPDKIPQVVEQAADILFARLDSMSVACFDRLVNWLSHHISNFGFLWHWKKWSQSFTFQVDTSATKFQPMVVFLAELLKKCLRLSYHQRIVEIQPDIPAGVLPPAPLPHLKFTDELLPGAMLSRNLLEAMRSKQSCPEKIISLLSGPSDVGLLLKINVFTQNCIYLGSKSFSHTFAILAKYHSVFKNLSAGDSERQHAILKGIFEVWVDSEHFRFVVAEKLLRMEVLESRCIVSWIFGPLMRKELSKMYIWELLHSTVRWVKNLQRRNAVVEVDSPSGTDYVVTGILLDIVHRFVKALRSAPVEQEKSEERYWFNWVLGRLQETLFIYADDYKKMSSKLVKISEETELRGDISKTIQGFLAYVM